MPLGRVGLISCCTREIGCMAKKAALDACA